MPPQTPVSLLADTLSPGPLNPGKTGRKEAHNGEKEEVYERY